MAANFVRKWSPIPVLLMLLHHLAVGNCSRLLPTEPIPSDAFHSYQEFRPYMLHHRAKREVDTRTDNGHLEELSLVIEAFGKNFVVDLQMNRDLFPNHHFEEYQSNGEPVIRHTVAQNDSHCYYKGRLQNVKNSWAALSTCNGLSGVIFDGHELHYIQPIPKAENGHYIYKHSDLKPSNWTCGYQNAKNPLSSSSNSFSSMLKKRFRRNVEIRGPYNSNSQSRYVELVLVNDNKLFKDMKEDYNAVIARSKDIANIANALYASLNIFIALVGVVVWTEFDLINLSNDGDTTLTNFLYYRRERLVQDHPNDNAQLITGISFTGGVVGKALKGPICTYEYSGGVNMDHNPVVGLVATTVAHELGHNFGMEHDDDDCECPEEKCIMAPASSHTSPTHWSSCSLDYLKMAYEHGMDYCLRNKPTTIVGPVCGNGFVESGEECDCGLKKFCDNPCCNATSCTLYPNATCATGQCCDLQTCMIKPVATPCRDVETECDLPEFCTGLSEFCPSDVYKQDGITCKGGRAYCFHGQCRSHTDQCKLLWGSTGQMSDKQCFNNNRKGTAHGNCGYFRVNKTYKSCPPEDTLCGMLHCTHLNEKLEFGMESVAILSRSFITEGDQVLTCRSAMVDLGLNSVDPGLAPDGARCGPNKVCVNQRCLDVASLKVFNCEPSCGSHGICNNKGHCHCDVGYEPPYCDYPGSGGSIISGPASDPNAKNYFAYAMYIIFLAIVPMVALSAAFFYYCRGHIITWWIAKARERAVSRRAKDACQRRNRPPSKLGSEQSGFRSLNISAPISTTSTATTTVVKSSPTQPFTDAGLIHSPSSTTSGPIAPSLQRTHSVKAAKLNLDRDSLRNLEISHPIPQLVAALPSSVAKAVPIRPAPPRPISPPQISCAVGSTVAFSSAERARPPSWGPSLPSRPAPGIPSVTRAESLQEGSRGSTRLKRLSSSSFRPTNPPPRPPLPRWKPENESGDMGVSDRIYESVIYSDDSLPKGNSLDKGVLRFVEDGNATPASDGVNKVVSASTAANRASPASHLYSELKPTGSKSAASKLGSEPVIETGNGSRAPGGGGGHSFLGSSSLVGNLAKRFEAQGSNDGPAPPQPPAKVPAKDSFRFGGTSFWQNKPPFPPKPLLGAGASLKPT